MNNPYPDSEDEFNFRACLPRVLTVPKAAVKPLRCNSVGGLAIKIRSRDSNISPKTLECDSGGDSIR